MSDANKTQVGGIHYASQIQHWDFVVANDLNYFEGQITKYVARCRKKNGIEDLKKAQHFLAKYLEVYVRVATGDWPAPSPDICMSDFENDQPTYMSDRYFLCEGGWGDGKNLYTCKVCRAQVAATGLVSAHTLHAQPCGLPRVGGGATTPAGAAQQASLGSAGLAQQAPGVPASASLGTPPEPTGPYHANQS